ncbi:MAG TPA: zinc-dependent alcohol dehydrogenase family protein [Solirubrobacteraceae bacterium]|nr:zinc-dependent alcohol dehydrogenase family protein [Solirubrobacteraceae bacterium]
MAQPAQDDIADGTNEHTQDMNAMLFEAVHRPLRAARVPVPRPAPGQLLLRVHACGVCRTDLHLLDGEVTVARPPRILGHQIVATVVGRSPAADPAAAGMGGLGGVGGVEKPFEMDAPRACVRARVGRRVGVPWLGWTCGECEYCRSGHENLCPRARFTGRDIDGGMAEYAVADERFCFPIPGGYPDEQAAPLLCAGLIGYRALRMCGEATRLGLYGFGAAAHILAQVARHQGREVYAFTRPGDEPSQAFARELGAVWAGDSDRLPPRALHAAIVFAPDGSLVPAALRAVAPGGTVVCGGIHMSDIPSFPYEDLWRERVVRSVANLTRADATEFLALAPEVPVRTSVTTYPLAAANEALADLRAGRFEGAAVLVP